MYTITNNTVFGIRVQSLFLNPGDTKTCDYLSNDDLAKLKSIGIVPSGTAAGASIIASNSVLNVVNNYLIQNIDYTILVDATTGPLVLTLPPASNSRQQLNIKKIDSSTNSITIQTVGSDLIDKQANYVFNIPLSSITTISDGVSNWWLQ